MKHSGSTIISNCLHNYVDLYMCPSKLILSLIIYDCSCATCNYYFFRARFISLTTSNCVVLFKSSDYSRMVSDQGNTYGSNPISYIGSISRLQLQRKWVSKGVQRPSITVAYSKMDGHVMIPDIQDGMLPFQVPLLWQTLVVSFL